MAPIGLARCARAAAVVIAGGAVCVARGAVATLHNSPFTSRADLLATIEDASCLGTYNSPGADTTGVSCQSANGVAITAWDVSAVDSFEDLFDDMASFNADISAWNTQSVTNMNGMFRGATVFNQNIKDWDTSKVTDMGGMFLGARAFNQPIGT